jgi:hypothetical protein
MLGDQETTELPYAILLDEILINVLFCLVQSTIALKAEKIYQSKHKSGTLCQNSCILHAIE